MTSEWWHWLAAGLALIVVEVTASGGFYFIFFGAGAIIVAALRLLDLAEPLWLQLLVFSVLSVVSLLVFRNPLLRWMKLDRPGSRSARTSTRAVVTELDKASEPWGIKVLRYEIKNITPPQDVLAAMEKQMRAEREKRAVILTSEGTRDAAINTAEGETQQVRQDDEVRRSRTR